LRARRNPCPARSRSRRAQHGGARGDQHPRVAAGRPSAHVDRPRGAGLLLRLPGAGTRAPLVRRGARAKPLRRRRAAPPVRVAGLPAGGARCDGARQAPVLTMTAGSLTMPRRATPLPPTRRVPLIPNSVVAIVVIVTAEAMLFAGLIGAFLVF